MAQDDEWASGFVLNSRGLSRLHVWSIFHDRTQYDALQPVPPIPPMVLQMLNQASMEVRWTLDVLESTRHATRAWRDAPYGERFVPVKTLLEPNWWRNFALTCEPDPAWLATLRLRMRRLCACFPVSSSVSRLVNRRPLVELDISYTVTSSEGLEDLAHIPTLTKLNANFCKSVTSVTCLACSTSLVEIDVSETGITSEGLVGLERIPTLTKLNASFSRAVTSVTCLAASTSLVELDLSGTRMTSEGLEGLARIPTLTKLNLRACTALTSVACLGGSASLVDVDLRVTSITPEGLEGLERIPTLTNIVLRGCRGVRNGDLLNRFQDHVLVIPPE